MAGPVFQVAFGLLMVAAAIRIGRSREPWSGVLVLFLGPAGLILMAAPWAPW